MSSIDLPFVRVVRSAHRLLPLLGVLAMSALPPAPATAAVAATASVEVDARQAPRGIQSVHLQLPVKPGKLTLLYPEWLPGDHAPTGPIGGLSGLRFSVNGQRIPWQRDAENMFAFHLTVPAGASALDAQFEVDAVADASNNNALRISTESLALVLWNQLVLYPAGAKSDDLQYRATLRLPAGFNLGTALPVVGAAGDTTQFAAVSLTTLIDSPVLAGRHFKTVDLGGAPKVSMHLAADSDAALAMPPATAAAFRNLVAEATHLFGATHYNEYHFLWILSDQTAFEGIEHHQSSDNRSSERSLIDDDLRRSSLMTLLPHEYTHSWNGKYRRPIGLATGNYDSPMHGDMLWVYEGLTEYLGMVLTARSGLVSPDDARGQWADAAAWLQLRKGRDWRPLADTAIAAQIGYTQAREWQPRTRGTDFYGESALLWLEADTLIRKGTQGAKSLDDFCKAFHGAPSTAPKVVTYDFNDVIKSLNAVMPYDWRGFWTERLNRVNTTAPLDGLTASGWRLTFADDPSPAQRGDSAADKSTDLRYSLGFTLKDEGAVITDVVPGTPADLAGLAPDSALIAVNGRRYTKDVLQDVLNAGGTEPRTIRLLIQKNEQFDSYDLRYAGKSRHPRLERDPSVPDLLTAILAPHAGADHAAAAPAAAAAQTR